MKKNHENNHGLVKSSLANPAFKCSKNKSPPSISNNSQISKYFIKKDSDLCEDKKQNMEKPTNFDSPYKNIVTEPTAILNDSLQDENDFKSPNSFRPIVKTVTSKLNTKKSVNKKRKTKKSAIKRGVQKKLTNMIQDNFSYSDTNPEHLQMALALSKSEQSEENFDNYPTTQTKILNVRKTLEKFGFKADKQIRKNIEVIKKPKKSRYQYITPTLYLRTEEDRENLIASKISLILSQSSLPQYSYEKTSLEVKSRYLSDLTYKSARIFNLNNVNDGELNADCFYVKDLKIAKSDTKCGHLLKDWKKIPGREISPERKILNSTSLINKSISGTNIKVVPMDIKTLDKNIDINLQENKDNSDLNFTLREETQKASEILICNGVENITDIQNNKVRVEINLDDKLEPRTISPDLFTSDDEDINYINKTIENKLQSSLEMISNIKRLNISQIMSEKESTNINTSIFVEYYSKNNIVCFEDLEKTSRYNEILSNESKYTRNDITATNSKPETVISSSAGNEYEQIQEIITSKTVFAEVHAKNITQDKCNKISSSEETIKDTGTEITGANIQGGETMNQSININEDITTPLNFSFFEATDLQKEVTQSIQPAKNQSKDSAVDNQYSNFQPELNDTDDILSTLEITFTKNISPKIKNINACSASLLSNFGSLDKSDNQKVYGDSSDDSDYNATYENFNGIQHFESFYDEQDKSKGICDLTESNEEDAASPRITDQNKRDNANYGNVSAELLNHISCTDQNYSMSHEEKLENAYQNSDNKMSVINLDTKDMSKQSFSSKNTKSRSRKPKYEILSDSEDTCIYEFENDDEWQTKYKNSNIRQLLEKSIINHENLQLDVAKNDFKSKETFRKSLSFTSLQANNCSLEISNDFKKYPTFSTPSRNKSVSSSNKCTNSIKQCYSNSSISSESCSGDGAIYVSDEELNYSSIHSTPYPKNKNDSKKTETKLSLPNSDADKVADKSINVLSGDEKNNVSSYSYLEKYYDDFQYNINENQTDIHTDLIKDNLSPLTHPRISQLSNKKSSAFKNSLLNKDRLSKNKKTTPVSEKVANEVTPDGHVIMKTKNITPMPDYDNMNTPTVSKELEKIGVKQLKRHRGVQILKHIYETTHPVLESYRVCDDEDDSNQNVKRRKVMKSKSRRRLEIEASSSIDAGSFGMATQPNISENSNIEIVGDIAESEDLIFERKQSKKISTCRMPLHIAFHNLVSSNQQLKQNILLYEPLQLEVLYEMLKEQGHKYHIQDLLTFLDKKCITIRTNQNMGQRKRY